MNPSVHNTHLDQQQLVLLLRGLLHELANAVTIVEGAGYALEDELDETTKQEVSQDLCATSEELRQLIERTRASVGLRAMHPVTTRLQSLVDAGARKAELKDPPVLLDNAANERLYGDKACLVHLFAELFANAQDANSSKPVEIAVQRDGEQVLVRVTDSGEGMTPEVTQQAFEPYFSQRTRRGAGLGLTAANGVALQHRGTLELSATASGSCVTVTLPSGPDAGLLR